MFDYLMLFSLGCFALVIIIQAVMLTRLHRQLDELEQKCGALETTGIWWKEKCLRENTMRHFKAELPKREGLI